MATPRSWYVAPIIANVDLAFRPHSYWADANPIDAITQNIKGQYRREYVRHLLETPPAERPDGIRHELVGDTLTPELLHALEFARQETHGGEFLPDYRKHEVEIARIAFLEGRRPVFSVRARRSPVTTRYHYRLVDEDGTTFTGHRKSSRVPLTLGELSNLIDTASSPRHRSDQFPLVEEMLLDLLVNEETEFDQWERIRVQSCVYPALEFNYWWRLRHFVMRCSDRHANAAKRARRRE